MRGLYRDLQEAFRRYQADDGGLMAAAVAYYATLSFFPLILLLIAALGFLFRFTAWGDNAEREVLEILAAYSSTQLTDQVATVLSRIERGAVFGARLGGLGLLITTAGLFVQFEKAFDRIWNVDREEGKGMWFAIKRALLNRLQAFGMLLGLGGLLVLTSIASVVLTGMQRWSAGVLPEADALWNLAQFLLVFALNTLTFTLLYRFLTKVHVGWRPAAQGAVFAALVWEMGRWLLAAFVVGPKYTVYGVVGAILAVMLWAYYASVVVFLGAELVQVYCGYGPAEKVPLKTAPAGEQAHHGANI